MTSNATNVIGTLNVLLAARDHGVRRVVCASSSSVYGSSGGIAPKQEDTPAVPISPYATAKLAGEGYARSFHGVYGLETVALRYFNVFGRRQDPTSQYAAVIPNFIKALLAGEPPVIFGNGDQSRDFTYVANIVQANILAMDAPGVGGKAYNIACGERVTLNRLLFELGDLLGSAVEPIYAPRRPGDIKHSLADLSLARRELGYEPAVPLREGLQRTIQHFHAELSTDVDHLIGAHGRSLWPIYHRLGVGIYEDGLNWSMIARRRPRHPRDPRDRAYRWPAEVTKAVAQAARSHIRVALMLTQSPRWANGRRRSVWAPLRTRDFADFATAAARRYPSVHLWMIWGEPSRAGDFKPSARVRSLGKLTTAQARRPHIYARLLDAAYHALKVVSRKNLVIGGMTFTARPPGRLGRPLPRTRTPHPAVAF